MSDIVCGDFADSRRVAQIADDLCRWYPFLHRTAIGKSVCGRVIEALSVGHGKHAVLFVAGIRAQESITSTLGLRLTEMLCRLHSGEIVGNHPPSLSERTLVILPLLNPDGIDIALHGSQSGKSHADLLHAHGADIKGYWQANAVGVDLSANFAIERAALQKSQREHGIVGPCGRGFGGTSPESEPETKALANLCRRMPFSHAVTLSCGNGIVFWQYGDRTPPHARMTARFLAHAGKLSLAPPNHPVTSGGFNEWFMSAFGRPSFNIAVPVIAYQPTDRLFDRLKEALSLAAAL